MDKYMIQLMDSLNSEDECFVHFGHLNAPSPLMLVQFGYQATTGGYGYGPNIRDHYLLHFVRRGTGIFQANDREYQIGAGSVFAIYPHQISYYQASRDDPWEYFWIGFEGAWSEEVMTRIGFEKARAVAVQIADPERVFALLEEVLRRVRENLHPDQQIFGILGCVYEILQMLSESAGKAMPVPQRETVGQLGHAYTRILISIIETSYAEQINVQQLADHLNVNRSYLSDLFKRDTGMSIKQYLTEYRLERVRLGLSNPDKTIKRIAMECGFSDPLYLSRLFRRHYGVSPAEYRERENGGPRAE